MPLSENLALPILKRLASPPEDKPPESLVWGIEPSLLSHSRGSGGQEREALAKFLEPPI